MNILKTIFGIITACAILAGCSSNEKADSKDTVEANERGILRLTMFKGVDGQSYSTDGSTVNRYPEYSDREQPMKVNRNELLNLINELTDAGFFSESHPPLSHIGIPPQTYTIIIKQSEREFECTWFHRRGATIPIKYLDVLEAVPDYWKTSFFHEFIDDMRKLHE